VHLVSADSKYTALNLLMCFSAFFLHIPISVFSTSPHALKKCCGLIFTLYYEIMFPTQLHHFSLSEVLNSDSIIQNSKTGCYTRCQLLVRCHTSSRSLTICTRVCCFQFIFGTFMLGTLFYFYFFVFLLQKIWINLERRDLYLK
jgi:hypothetical protein